jgi:rod shape-determining protein MreD
VTPPLRFLVLTILLLGGQQLVASTLPERIRPDLLLVFALALGLRPDATRSLVVAFVVGYGVDLLSGSPAGLYALLRGTACAATRVADRILYLRAPAPWALYCAGYQTVDLCLIGVLAAVLPPEGGADWGGLLARSPGALIMTGLVAIPMAILMDRWGIAPTTDPGSGRWAAGRSRP